ncbi:MAG: hypothetical protein B7Y95_24870, partial [Rhizobiales bacterium 32-66-11]
SIGDSAGGELNALLTDLISMIAAPLQQTGRDFVPSLAPVRPWPSGAERDEKQASRALRP